MKINKVQIFIIILVVAVTMIAIGVLSGRIPGLSGLGGGEKADLVMWGTAPQRALRDFISNFERQNKNISLEYVQKAESSFESELINALATGSGPDLVIFPSDLILKHRDKFLKLPTEVITERDFRNTFADGSEILIFTDGVLGFPLVADPLLLYWNKDLFRNDGISRHPETWDEFLDNSRTLTKIDPAGNITQSGSALGLTNNVKHFKEILSLLILQTGNPIVEGGTNQVVLGRTFGGSQNAAENALRFYAEFANPQKASYSWSPAQINSTEAFTRGTLAMYFGFASEVKDITESNPHLNFDVASVPQIRGGMLTLTYGEFAFLGIMRQSQSPNASLQVMRYLTSATVLDGIAQALSLAPSRRDLLSRRNENPILDTIRGETVRMKSWLDIDPETTSGIFREMIQSVTSGRKDTNAAVRDANALLERLYRL